MIVGREVVLEACDAALAQALSGRGRLMLLGGEAGIGKTTVAREIADRAQAADAVVRWGACWEGDTLLPFGMWLEALRRPGDDECAAAAGQLEQGRREIGADAPTAERARARFFDDVVEALRDTAERRPQVLLFEDVHWADAGSLELLRALAPRLPAMAVLVLATFRSEETAGGGPLTGIGGAADHLSLEGLDDDEVSALLADVLGEPPTPDKAHRIRQQTGGNPLFVTQVGRLLASGSSAQVPSGVRDVLDRRLARVSAACDRLLGAAAVVGTEFDADLLAELLGEDEVDVLATLDEAVAARLVNRPADPTQRWMFIHDLVRLARYEALGAAERLDLHRRVVDALGQRDVPAGVVAHHAARARFDADDPLPAELAVAAAREALSRLAWDEAGALARRALDAAPEGADGDELRAEAWLALGDARLRAGAHDAADAFVAAAVIGRDLGQAEVIARAALGFGAGLGSFEVRLLDRRQLDLLEEAVDALPDGSPLRPLVLARLSVALSFVGSPRRRLALADEAVTTSRALGDDRALAAALAARCDALAGPDHVAERLGVASEIVALAQRASDPALELLGRRLRVVALLELRDLPGFDAEVAAFARLADDVADPLYRWWPLLWRGMRAHADGRLDEAVELIERAGALGRSGGSVNADLLRNIALTFIALDRRDEGRLDELWDEIVQRHPDLLEQVEATAAMLAYVSARRGQVDRTRAHLARVDREALDRVPRDQEWLAAVTQFLTAGIVVGDEELVAGAHELLLPHAGLGVFEGAAAADHGVLDRFLARSAAFLGDHEAARRHVDAALRANAGAGRLVLAQTRADAARSLCPSPEAADRARGEQLARAARDEFETLGLAALAEETGALLGNGPVASSAAAVDAFVCEGDAWAVTFDGTTVRVRDAKGIADLAILLARPDREVHVRTLEGLDDLDLPSSHQAALDDTAVEQYRQRLTDLEDELQEAEDHHDVGRADRLRAERDALVDELTGALGLGGRRRSAGTDPDERLRKAVSARVKASIGKLEDLHPALGRHLRTSVRTGLWCAYEPERPRVWRVSTGRET